VTKVPSCVCFQCGYLLYPDAAKTIKVRNITDKGQCRAYRVFAHYINKMQRTTGDTFFKCEVQGTAAMVFACNYCVRQCSSKENGQTVYDQVLPSQLDFFDGVRADGSYTSIGIGDEQPDALAALGILDRLALAVLKMADASFGPYSGAGYTHMHGGGLLVPADYRGLASIMFNRTARLSDLPAGVNAEHVRAALDLLRVTNPIVEATLTCFERELNGDAFPAGAGGAGALPSLPESAATMQGRRWMDVDSSTEPHGADLLPDEQEQAHRVSGLGSTCGVSLNAPRFLGSATTVLDFDGAATEQCNSLGYHSFGDRVLRSDPSSHYEQPVLGESAETSPENAVHTVLYPYGEGGFVSKRDKTGVLRDHFRKMRLCSCAEPFRCHTEVCGHIYT